MKTEDRLIERLEDLIDVVENKEVKLLEKILLRYVRESGKDTLGFKDTK